MPCNLGSAIDPGHPSRAWDVEQHWHRSPTRYPVGPWGTKIRKSLPSGKLQNQDDSFSALLDSNEQWPKSEDD